MIDILFVAVVDIRLVKYIIEFSDIKVAQLTTSMNKQDSISFEIFPKIFRIFISIIWKKRRFVPHQIKKSVQRFSRIDWVE